MEVAEVIKEVKALSETGPSIVGLMAPVAMPAKTALTRNLATKIMQPRTIKWVAVHFIVNDGVGAEIQIGH